MKVHRDLSRAILEALDDAALGVGFLRCQAHLKDDAFSDARVDVALFGFLTVDHPRDAEAIREHTETDSPERFLQRHANGPSFR
jgi:hypothetical protein